MLDEENLLKLIIVEEEDDYEGEDDEEEEELVREEKEEDRHDIMKKTADDKSIEDGEIQEEEGTSGGYFDLLPVSDKDLVRYSHAGEVCYLSVLYWFAFPFIIFFT